MNMIDQVTAGDHPSTRDGLSAAEQHAAPLSSAPKSIQGWFAAEKSADPTPARRAVLSPQVEMLFGGHKIKGIEAILQTVSFVMPPGWLGEVDWSVLPTGADGRVTVRAVGAGGAPLRVLVPGAKTQTMDAMDFIFTLDEGGLIVGMAGQAHHPEPSGVSKPLQLGSVAPDFVLPDVYGVPVALGQSGAQATVAVFISNHCPFSAAWHQRIQQVGRDYAARGVRLLQINANDPALSGPKDEVEHARELVANGHFAGTYLIDRGQVVARQWGARHTPEVFVLDEQGKLAYHGAPDADPDDESLRASWLRDALDHILAGTLPDPAETPPIGCSIKWSRES